MGNKCGFLASEYETRKKWAFWRGLKVSETDPPLIGSGSGFYLNSSSDPGPDLDHDRDPDPGPTMPEVQIQIGSKST